MSHPQPAAVGLEPDKGYAINAADERRPWMKGIPGYTGHQHPPVMHKQPGEHGVLDNACAVMVRVHVLVWTSQQSCPCELSSSACKLQ